MSSNTVEKTPSSAFQKPLHAFHFRDPYKLADLAKSQGDWKTVARCYAEIIDLRVAEISLINSVQQGLSAKLDMQDIFDLVGDELRDTFNAQVVMISQYDPEKQRVYHHYAIERGQHLNIQGWLPIDVTRKKIVETQKPVLLNTQEILDLLGTAKMKVIPGTETPKAWLGVPMIVGGRVCGVVSLQNLDKENAFSQSDIKLLATLTNSMSLSLENARLSNETQRLLGLLEKEMEIARRTQQSILPSKLPSRAGYDFGSLMVPARAVGGDFYDFIKLGRHQQGIVLGDVSDKGLPAALFMALTFSLLRAEIERSPHALQVLTNVNHHLRTMNEAGMFVTLLYSIFDYRTGTLKVSRAGHLKPLVMDGTGKFQRIPLYEGQPLGLFEYMKIDQQEYTVPPAGLVLFYSDGLNESINWSGQEFGENRIREILSANKTENAQTICDRLFSAVQVHCGDILHQDDLTMVLIKRL